MASSQYKGVYFVKGKVSGQKQWRSILSYKGENIYLGDYITEEEAALAYDKKAIELKGDKAKINGINEKKVVFKTKPIQKASQYVGVSFHNQQKKWLSHIRVDGQFKSLGLYGTELEAALARDRVAVQLQGSKARLNFKPLAE